jgi:hypothetical protein
MEADPVPNHRQSCHQSRVNRDVVDYPQSVITMLRELLSESRGPLPDRKDMAGVCRTMRTAWVFEIIYDSMSSESG